MKKSIKVGGQFSGVGAFDQALISLGIEFENIYQAEWDKYARQTYLHNYDEPEYYVKDVYDTPVTEITEKHGSLDIAMFSPPCQAFSLAGKRLGKDDKRGILFFNSHEFIQENKPRFFIFENVKGLLSDDSGKTFSEWINMLGGKSVNGLPIIFPYEDSVPYHIYWKVLNAKDYNIPQNRERVFIVGIRDDADNVFSWPIEEPLTRKLKDVLEIEVDEKYFLSEKMVSYLIKNQDKRALKFADGNETHAACITSAYHKMPTDGQYIQIKSATSKGYELATENDSINFTHPNSKTRRGRVSVAQTLDTACNQGVLVKQEVIQINPSRESGGKQPYQQNRVYSEDGISPALLRDKADLLIKTDVCIPVLTPDRVEKRQNGRRFKDDGEEMFTITTQDRHGVYDGYRIRRLTPRECFRLMDFPESFSWQVSDSQAYKQAGNSICVGVLAKIIKGFKKLHD